MVNSRKRLANMSLAVLAVTAFEHCLAQGFYATQLSPNSNFYMNMSKGGRCSDAPAAGTWMKEGVELWIGCIDSNIAYAHGARQPSLEEFDFARVQKKAEELQRAMLLKEFERRSVQDSQYAAINWTNGAAAAVRNSLVEMRPDYFERLKSMGSDQVETWYLERARDIVTEYVARTVKK